MEQLEGRVAVVTGAGSGIGEGIAEACAGAGMHVVVSDIDGESAERVAAELRAGGVRSIAVRADVTDRGSVDALAASAYEEFGAVHLLCNNAGVIVNAALAEIPLDDLQFMFAVNFFGVVNGVQAFVPRMRAQGAEAHIVNTSSMAGLVHYDGIGGYTASKHAVVGFSVTLQGELEPDGIGVSVLCPGGVRSNLGLTSARNRPQEFGGPREPRERVAPRNPDAEQRRQEPREVGERVLAAVRANRLFVLSHPETRPEVERRYRRILDDYEHAASPRIG